LIVPAKDRATRVATIVDITVFMIFLRSRLLATLTEKAVPFRIQELFGKDVAPC
jgi:hypothetical protein